MISLLLVPLAVGACGTREAPVEEPASRDAAALESGSDPSPELRIVFLGDSLTAGFGLAEAQAFPAIVAGRLAQAGIAATVVNAGVSGDTTAGGLSRTDWVLRQVPDVLVVGLGGNDGLRGLSAVMTEENLRQILGKALAAGARPILLGLKLPPNLGPDYTAEFEAVFPRLASELDVPLVPFMLEGVAGVPQLNLPDGIHPTAEGHEIIAETVFPWVLDAVRKLESRKSASGSPAPSSAGIHGRH